MKILNKLSKLFCALAVIALAISCENISNPEPIEVIDPERTATIEGFVYANLDETNDTTGTIPGNFEHAPPNTSLKLVLNSRDFVTNPQAGINYQDMTYTTEVDLSGRYSFEVPARSRPINAELYLEDFLATQVQADSSQGVREFSPAAFPYNITITEGLATIQDVTYIVN